MPKQIEVGKTYYMDEKAKWSDEDGDEYAVFYSDQDGMNRIGNLLTSHFCVIED